MEEAAEGDASDRRAADAYRETELAFHRALLRASGNDALVRVAEPIQRALGMVRSGRVLNPARVERELNERVRIARAVERGDPNAARAAMRVHLEGVGEEMRKLVRSTGAASAGGIGSPR
jgi:DNA-binding FadR family transcriptional regulator